jgi:hypothetical protein
MAVINLIIFFTFASDDYTDCIQQIKFIPDENFKK